MSKLEVLLHVVWLAIGSLMPGSVLAVIWSMLFRITMSPAQTAIFILLCGVFVFQGVSLYQQFTRKL